MKFVFFLTLLLVPFSEPIANACAISDLTAAKNSPFSELKPFEQSLTGSCYAAATNMLVDYYRYSHGDESGQTSLLYSAFIGWDWSASRTYPHEIPMHGGNINDVVLALKAKGGCSRDEVNEEMGKYLNTTPMVSPETQILNFINLFYEITFDYNYCGSSREGYGDYKRTFDIIEKIDSLTCFDEQTRDQLQLESLDIPKLTKMFLPHLIEDKEEELYTKLLKPCFAKKKALTLPDLETLRLFNQKQEITSSIISNVLISKKQPIAIAFCANVFENPTYSALRDSKGKPIDMRADCKNHAALIVGSRKQKNTCEYLILNSTLNQTYHAKWEKKFNPEKNLNAVWIDSKALLNNMSELNYFK